jgi:hypothetical protein
MSARDAAEPPQSAPLECAQALKLVRRFVSGDEQVAERVRLRAHLASCPECNAQYRSEVVLLSRLARGGERSLESVQRMKARASRELARGQGRRRVPLVRLVLPAVGLYAIFVIVGPALGGAAQLECLAGEVHVGNVLLAPGAPAADLARGALCTSGANARAKLTCGDTVLVLEPDTALLFERGEPLRVRLFGGRLAVDGAATVTSAAGVVEVPEGAGAIEFAAGALSAVADNASWNLCDAAGDQPVLPGERRTVVLGQPRAP